MLRASATIRQWPGTTLPAVPPSIVPTFAVVPSSRRPSGIRATAADAAAIALLPSSGLIPAWASTPWNSATICCWVGVLVITSPTALAWSRMNPQSERRVAGVDRLRAPQPLLLGDGQQQLDPDRRRIGGVAGGELDEDGDGRLVVGAEDRRAAAAEDTVLLDDLDPARCGTVSMWAQNIAQRSPVPGSRARMLPDPALAGPAASSSPTSSPIARSSAISLSAISRSSPVTLRISQSRANLSAGLSTAELG